MLVTRPGHNLRLGMIQLTQFDHVYVQKRQKDISE